MQPLLERLVSAPLSDKAVREPLHVTIVDEELPYPPTSGKRIRTLNLVRRLAGRHRLTLLCQRNADPAEAQRAEAHFRELGVRTVVVDRTVPAKSGPLFYCRLAANLLSPLPYSVVTHDSLRLRRAVQRHAARHRVDLWQCEWTPYGRVLQAVPGPKVINAQNVESVIWQRYFETETNVLKRWYIGRQWSKFQRFERRVLSTATGVVVVSDVDARRMREELNVPRVAVVENGVDTDYFQPQHGAREPHHLLFLGSLDWRPNLDGVRHLLDETFPKVRAAVPLARLSVVGRNPPQWLRKQVERLPGVELHANVPDVRPHLARCSVLVVPLRIGGGSRLKILEALAAGVPVVSTAVGAEGLCLEPDAHFVQVPSLSQLARAIVDALGDPARIQKQATAGRRVVLERYDWDHLADKLEQVWLTCVDAAGLAAHR